MINEGVEDLSAKGAVIAHLAQRQRQVIVADVNVKVVNEGSRATVVGEDDTGLLAEVLAEVSHSASLNLTGLGPGEAIFPFFFLSLVANSTFMSKEAPLLPPSLD